MIRMRIILFLVEMRRFELRSENGHSYESTVRSSSLDLDRGPKR